MTNIRCPRCGCGHAIFAGHEAWASVYSWAKCKGCGWTFKVETWTLVPTS